MAVHASPSSTPQGGPHGTGESHGSYGSYMIGFALSVVLTVAAFWLVMEPGFSKPTIFATIAILAVVQVAVHLYYFLHLNFSSEMRWNVVAFAFAAGIVLILVSGSLWIMYNINENMVENGSATGTHPEQPMGTMPMTNPRD